MAKRTCKICNAEKLTSQFYGGYQCKECIKARVKQNRLENLEYYKEYDRQRGHLPYRKEANRARYKKVAATEKGRKRLRAYARDWVEKNRHKRNVHIVVGNAIKRGLIIPERCTGCSAEKAQAHHEDYSKPFEITWLCETCHGKRHRELNEKNR